MCPVCESQKNKVVDSRKEKNKVWRRRKCECGISFSTYEISDTYLFDLMERLDEFHKEIGDVINGLGVRG